MKKPMNTEDHGLFMETAGIEPAGCSSRSARKIPANEYNSLTRKASPRRANARAHGTGEMVLMHPKPNPVARGLPVTAHRRIIRAFAIVDAEDYERLSRFRWHFDNLRWRLVKRAERQPDGRYARRYLHREVLGLEPGDPRSIDHINGDTLDNRRANLRIATTAQNAQNQGSRGGSSRFRGVTWDRSRRKWMASAMLDGRRTTIGRFDSEDEAALAAVAWRAQHMPFSEEAA